MSSADHSTVSLPLHEDLQAVVRNYLIRELPTDPSAMLRYERLDHLHSIYATWRARVPESRPRRVHVSPELRGNPDRLAYGDGLAALIAELIDGRDLRPRMSKAIEEAYTPFVPFPSKKHLRAARHRDRLLADWGLHHMHLGAVVWGRGGFVKRTRHVVLAAFQPNDVYLIDLVDHESNGANWSALGILETIVRNWPDSGVLRASDFLTGLVGGNWSDDDRRELREAGVNTGMVEIDGKVWSPASIGQMMDGAPVRIANFCMHADWKMRGWVQGADGLRKPDESALRQELTARAEKHGVPDEWRAHVRKDVYGFGSGRKVFVPYGNLLPDF